MAVHRPRASRGPVDLPCAFEAGGAPRNRDRSDHRTHASPCRRDHRATIRSFPDGRRYHLHRPSGLGRGDPRGDHRRDRGNHHHRARRDAPRRPDKRCVDGAAQARRLLLMSIANTSPVVDRGVLRFLTAGSVDDGKSTLIGRLLYDTKSILADQLAAIERTSQRRGQTLDLSLLTDGLVAEREQGITIDVAYRYFATAVRKFIIADAPGHTQYTRNMVTAASTAQLAILLVDARHGVVTQTRRHAVLAHLLGIQHLIVAVNKMDLVDYDQSVFAGIVADFLAFAERSGMENLRFVPMS